MNTALKHMMLLIALLAQAAGNAAQAVALDPTAVQKLLAADSAAGDEFGMSVSLSADGGTALIGKHCNDHDRDGSGAAYIFTRAADGTWHQQAKLTAADSAAYIGFGWPVALSADGGTALVAASDEYWHNRTSDPVCVFTRSADGTWHQQAKLTATDNTQNSRFGESVALSADGGTALIAAVGDEHDKGAAYLFTRSASGIWTQQAKLTAADRIAGDEFGRHVSLSADGGTALIGAENNDNDKGAAYVFIRSGGGWQQQAKLTAADGIAHEQFGCCALSADGGTALVGAENDYSGKGAAYLFTRFGGTWSQQVKLTAADSAAHDQFGSSVALSADGGTALIGHNGTDRGKGAAYVFTRSGGTWSEQDKLTAAGSTMQNPISVSLSADGGTALFGDYAADESGAAYVFTR